MTGTLLNLGCGDATFNAPRPWVNVDSDRRPATRPDVWADMKALPFADGSVARVYAGHVLEHLALGDEMAAGLAEIRRVLEPGGLLLVVGPDVVRGEGMHQRGEIDDERWQSLHTTPEHGTDPALHKWDCSGPAVVEILTPWFAEVAELESVREIGQEWPVWDRASLDQFAVSAVKARG